MTKISNILEFKILTDSTEFKIWPEKCDLLGDKKVLIKIIYKFDLRMASTGQNLPKSGHFAAREC